ncbi:MAG: NADH-quinone oxidoreductase subunit C [Desulfovibrionaceae bacterium]|nr:NADH-quinone oxidoreductase subunit C [Desulfovibrionaceae bacterium]
MPSTPTINRNDALHQLLKKATGTEAVWTGDVRGNPFAWLRLDAPDKLKDVAGALAGKARLCTITAYAEERDDPDKRRRIAYHFVAGNALLTVTIPIFDPESLQPLPVPSITPWFLNADWNEREFMEMFNIEITGHPNPKRLFLDERLDAGIMSNLIPFSAMAHGAASNTLWEQVLEAKGIPVEERMPSLNVPAEPIKLVPKVTPVSVTEPKDELAVPTLADVAAPAKEAAPAQETQPAPAPKPAAKSGKKPAAKKK